MFLLNSQPGLFSVIPPTFNAYASTMAGRPFSRSYGAILPSSLRRVLSSAFPYSGYLPVSDYGTRSYKILLQGFSWQCGIDDFAIGVPPARHNLLSLDIKDARATGLDRDIQHSDHPASCVTLKMITPYNPYRNINLLSIDYAFRPRLRID
jgi:hypothetical protein